MLDGRAEDLRSLDLRNAKSIDPRKVREEVHHKFDLVIFLGIIKLVNMCSIDSGYISIETDLARAYEDRLVEMNIMRERIKSLETDLLSANRKIIVLQESEFRLETELSSSRDIES